MNFYKPLTTAISIFLLSLISLIIYVIVDFHMSEKITIENALTNGLLKSEEREKFFKNQLENSSQTLFAIRGNKNFQKYSDGNDSLRELLEDFMLSIATLNADIMQIRFIDKFGKERIRIDRADDLKIKPKELLQDKSNRDYFIDAKSKKNLNKIWYSRIDLNIENGEIEKPLKPTIRAILPVLNNNQFNGILIVNYFAEQLLKDLFNAPLYNSILVDEEGYIIKHYNSDLDWSRFGTGLKIGAVLPNSDNIFKDKKHKDLNFISKKINLDIKGSLYLILSVSENYIKFQREASINKIKKIFLIFIPSSIFISFIIFLILNPLDRRISKTKEELEKAEKLKDALRGIEVEKKEKEQLLSLFDIGNVVIFKWRNEENWPVEYVSKNVDRIFGYSPEDFLNGKIIYSTIVAEDDVSRVGDEVTHAINNGLKFFTHKPYRVIAKNGDVRWVLDNSRVVRNKLEQITHFLGYISDVTELKLREIELEASKKVVELAIEGNGDGFWDWDISTGEVFFSKQWKAMLGFEEDEIEASLEEWKNRVHKDDLERVFSDVRDYLDDKSDKYVNTHRVLSKDGSYKWILDRGVAVERDSFGRPTRMVGTHTDITRDKEILEKLENSENRLRNLLEISPIAVRIAKKHGKKVVFANQTYKKLINLQNEKVVRENPQNYYANREVYENIVARIENCETISNELVELKIPNSETQWALATYTQIEFEGEEAVLGWFFDVTESKKLEDNLIEAREEAENANRAKGDFLANMSHEIRTPLNGVIGLVDLTLQTDLTNTQQEFLEKAKTSSKALLNVLNDILDYSKVEAGKLDLEEREFSLKELLETVVSLFGYRAEEKGISLKYEISENVPEILNGDSLRLSQVLNNLVGNGIKFTKEGGVLIRVSKSCDESDHFRLNFEIKDSGIGISEEKQKRLFQAFSQADTSHTREYGGTGLGLAISKQIVALFGGEISVKSVDGEGSNFSFNAIFSKADNMNKKETILIKDNSIDISLLENKRVLLVEDNEINQLVATKNLEKFKMKISVANNGKEALDKISKDSFDIILMDIQMPIMDGFEATKRIREEFSKDQLPIIAMSAAVMKEDKDLAEKVGMNDHLSKPFKVEDLQRILLKWLNLDSLKVTDFEHFDEENSLEENDIIIDFEKGIEFLDGDDELFRDLLFGFRDKYENIGDEVQKSLEENDFENAKKTLHTLKGLSGQICATSLNIEVQKLEKLVIEKEKPSLDKFRELLSKVIDEIKNIDDNSPKTGFLENENILEISREDCKELLLKFQNNINHSDIIEKDNLNKFQKCFGTISFKHVKDVLRYIDEFDYLNASKSLVKLEEEVFGKENSFNS